MEEEEIIADSPFRKIKVKFKENVQLPRIIPKNEIEQLLNFMYQHMDVDNEKRRGQKLRDVAVVEVLFATGARVYEISFCLIVS